MSTFNLITHLLVRFRSDWYNDSMKSIQFNDIALSTKDEALALLSSSTKGLPPSVASARLLMLGKTNLLGKRLDGSKFYYDNLSLIYIFASCCVHYLFFLESGLMRSLFFCFLLLMHTGFFQEYRAECTAVIEELC